MTNFPVHIHITVLIFYSFPQALSSCRHDTVPMLSINYQQMNHLYPFRLGVTDVTVPTVVVVCGSHVVVD